MTHPPAVLRYPEAGRHRDQWILQRRPPRNPVDPRRPYAFSAEKERAENGDLVSVATIFLTNRECPWHCLMCDLWKNTLTETAPVGAIPAQIDYAMAHLRRTGILPVQNASTAYESPSVPSPLPPSLDRPEAGPTLLDRPEAGPTLRQVKLYNSGSFFDPRAIPPADYTAIAERVGTFERVIVECHPALVGESTLRFRDLLAARAAAGGLPAKLEVALGLETVHPHVLAQLNKRMTLAQFTDAAAFLRRHEIALRVFILVKPPFLDEAEALHWANRSLDFAFECGATVASLIPVRSGNGALEALAARGEFAPPRLATLEAAFDYGLGRRRGRVFADLWDLEKFADCDACFVARAARLLEMNFRQERLPRIECRECGG